VEYTFSGFYAKKPIPFATSDWPLDRLTRG
jgi:hypothetical protein